MPSEAPVVDMYGTRTDRVYGAPACHAVGHLELTPGDGRCMYCSASLEDEAAQR